MGKNLEEENVQQKKSTWPCRLCGSKVNEIVVVEDGKAFLYAACVKGHNQFLHPVELAKNNGDKPYIP